MSNLRTVTVVTSFSEQGWHDYAEKMVFTAAEHWEPSIKLIAYYHDFDINTKKLPDNKNIEFRNLNDLEELNQFRDTYKKFNGLMACLLRQSNTTGVQTLLSFVTKYLQ
jgi:hypothetical protein